MTPINRDPWYTFRFEDDRVIPRFHLDGVDVGRQVSVVKIDPDTGEQLGLLATATVGEGGWVNLAEPITVKVGDAFLAVPITHHLTLIILPDTFAVCRLDADAAVPAWATAGDLSSITRTADELSIVCRQDAVPEGITCERRWRCLRVAGTMPFAVVGVLASLTTPLTEAGISVFAISTFDTDYMLMMADALGRAIDILRMRGHTIR
jgi:hypothetical protein